MEEKLVAILNEMAEYLSIAQMKKLQEVLLKNLAENEPQKAEISNAEYLQMFLDAKKIEGCSERTLQYYRVTVERMLQSITTPIRKIWRKTARLCTEIIKRKFKAAPHNCDQLIKGAIHVDGFFLSYQNKLGQPQKCTRIPAYAKAASR